MVLHILVREGVVLSNLGESPLHLQVLTGLLVALVFFCGASLFEYFPQVVRLVWALDLLEHREQLLILGRGSLAVGRLPLMPQPPLVLPQEIWPHILAGVRLERVHLRFKLLTIKGGAAALLTLGKLRHAADRLRHDVSDRAR